MKNIVEPSALSRFPIKLIFYTALGSASNFRCLLKSIAINLQFFLNSYNLINIQLCNHQLDPSQYF